MVSKAALATCACLSGAGHAETLSDLRTSFVGREIAIAGHIGTSLDLGDEEALIFRDAEGNIYPVTFDAGRKARKSLEGCKFAMFGGGSPCAMEGKAEVELDGSHIRLIIYEVVKIDPPAPL